MYSFSTRRICELCFMSFMMRNSVKKETDNHSICCIFSNQPSSWAFIFLRSKLDPIILPISSFCEI